MVLRNSSSSLATMGATLGMDKSRKRWNIHHHNRSY
ncbi:F-box domain-containing protein [Psidium guajava]|nr:F-box domain-containing protein [Psidium guajava]